MADATQLPCILIVDNDAISQRLFTAIYDRSEFHVEFCNTVSQAMAKLEQNKVDLVIAEIVLPDENGFELRKRVRLFQDDLSFIFVTSVLDSAGRKLLENLANDPNTFFQRKPILKSAMLELTRRVISGTKLRNQHRQYFEQLQSDLLLAAKMQQLMLPDWINLGDEHFYMVANYLPHSHLSGDYFDWLRLADGRYFFVIGDISGHGIRAALHMSVIQSLTRFFVKDVSPGNIICKYLNELNRQICMDFDSVFYLTCLVAIIDPVTQTLEYVSAGHPGFFACDFGKGKLKYLGSDGNGGENIPVGWMADYQYKPEDVSTFDMSGDMVFLALTDGVIERGNDKGEMLGIDGFAKSNPACDSRFLLPFLLETRNEEAGFQQVNDDMLIIALGFTRKPADSVFQHLQAIGQNMTQAGEVAAFTAEMVVKFLNDNPLSYKVELAAGEFFNNIIVHGFGGMMRIRPQILFGLTIYPGRVELMFIDQGKKWDYVPQTRSFDDDTSDDFFNFVQAGRGMRIIEDIVDSIERRRVGKLNVTVFHFSSTKPDGN